MISNNKRYDVGFNNLYRSFTQLKTQALLDLVTLLAKRTINVSVGEYNSLHLNQLKNKLYLFPYQSINNLLQKQSHDVNDYFFDEQSEVKDFTAYDNICFWLDLDSKCLKNAFLMWDFAWGQFHTVYPGYTLSRKDIYLFLQGCSTTDLLSILNQTQDEIWYDILVENIQQSFSSQYFAYKQSCKLLVPESFLTKDKSFSQANQVLPTKTREQIKVSFPFKISQPAIFSLKQLVVPVYSSQNLPILWKSVVSNLFESVVFKKDNLSPESIITPFEKDLIVGFNSLQRKFFELNHWFWKEQSLRWQEHLDEEGNLPSNHIFIQAHNFKFKTRTFYEYQLLERVILNRFKYYCKTYEYLKLTAYHQNQGNLTIVTYQDLATDFFAPLYKKIPGLIYSFSRYDLDSLAECCERIPLIKKQLPKGIHLFSYGIKYLVDYQAIQQRYLQSDDFYYNNLNSEQIQLFDSLLQKLVKQAQQIRLNSPLAYSVLTAKKQATKINRKQWFQNIQQHLQQDVFKDNCFLTALNEGKCQKDKHYKQEKHLPWGKSDDFCERQYHSDNLHPAQFHLAQASNSFTKKQGKPWTDIYHQSTVIPSQELNNVLFYFSKQLPEYILQSPSGFDLRKFSLLINNNSPDVFSKKDKHSPGYYKNRYHQNPEYRRLIVQKSKLRAKINFYPGHKKRKNWELQLTEIAFSLAKYSFSSTPDFPKCGFHFSLKPIRKPLRKD